MTYDSIVVGGGTAGSVVAARLSEDPGHRVLLLEAGPDYPHGLPAELLDASSPVTSGHNWDLQAVVAEGEAPASEPMARVAKVFELAAARLGPGQGAPPAAGARIPYPLGKVVGGGSAINGGLAFHARPEDYAAWAAAGNDEWSWERARPWVTRVEAADAARPALPLESDPPDGLTPCQEAFLTACLERGHARVDLRQGTACGVGLIPRNVDRAGHRVSAARLYLEGARARPNLTVQAHCLADRIVFADGGEPTATGVEAVVDGRRVRFDGGRVVLAAGTVHSPAVLLRSGIGAAGEVARLGVRPLLDLPGVGKDLLEHPAVSLWAVPRAGACREGEPIHQVMLQRRSSAAAGPLCDLQLFILGGLPTRKLPPLRDVVGSELAVGVSVVLATPASRGRVEVVDRDPSRSPRVFLNCLRDPGDLRRMKEGLRAAWDLLRSQRLAAHLDRVVLWNEGTFASDALVEKLARTTARGAWHPVGTLRMGRPGDPRAVVDQRGRLLGCANVTVADGSIMPALPSVPTNLTCMLIGERIAAHLRGLEAA